MTSGAVGNDGVASVSGQAPSGFGDMSSTNGPNSNSEGVQGGTGASMGDPNGGQASGYGGSSPGSASDTMGGTGGQGGDNDGDGGGDGSEGYALGGRISGISGLASGRGTYRNAEFERRIAQGSGLVPGAGGGRSDQLHIKVPRASYIIPADAVSAAGGGNTLAGARAFADALPRVDRKFAAGGIAGADLVPIRVSPGEFVVHPEHADAMGGPDALDQIIARLRAANAQTVAGMPPPR